MGWAWSSSFFVSDRQRRRGAAILSFALLAAAAASPAAAAKQKPFDVKVDVIYGPTPGSERFREEVEREVVRLLAESRCFRSAERVPEEGAAEGLMLRVTLGRAAERTRHEITLSGRDSPGRPPEDRRHETAHMEVRVGLSLSLLPDGRTVRERGFRAAQRYRPSYGEDGRYEVRRMLVERVARETVQFCCNGSIKRLKREIENAGKSD